MAGAGQGQGLIGGIAAGRPLLAGSVLAFAAAAIVAVGFRGAAPAFADAALAWFVALMAATALPSSIAALAPRNFWLRAILAGIIAGLLLALRRLFLQSGAGAGFSLAPFDLSLTLVIIASAAFFLSLGAMLAVYIASAFARSFAEGGDNFTAAASAARSAAAPAMFSLILAVAAIVFIEYSASGPGTTAALFSAANIAASAAAFSLAAPLFFGAGALALKAPTEMTAVIENRRRAALRPFLGAVRAVLPPSSAIAASAIFLIIAIVAGFETKTPPAFGEIALVTVIAFASALTFVSLRTALMTAILAAAAGRIASAILDIAGLAPPSESARVIAASVAAALSAQLFLAWRDRRNPRRKTREVVMLALGDQYFAFIAASALAIAALAASEAAGLWRDGAAAALHAGLLTAITAVAAPFLMTAIGVVFGRD